MIAVLFFSLFNLRFSEGWLRKLGNEAKREESVVK